MAGAGFKTFNAGDVLSATDVNTYLMQQTVMVTATAAGLVAGTAIPSASQGMVAYAKDEGRLYQYTGGAAWKPLTNFTTESGTVSVTGSQGVSFTSGRFTAAPVLLASVASSTNGVTSVTFSTPTSSSVTFYTWSGTTAATTARTVHWFAIQATG